MPYDPVDPASLEGEDLTSWYLRSPQEIEQQRQAAAQQRYNQFFYGDGSRDPPADDQAASGAYSSDQPPTFADTSGGVAPGLQKVSFVTPAGAAPDASCPTCHAPLPPSSPLPQPNWPSFPSGWNPVFPAWPMLRDMVGGGGGSKPPRKTPKQCEIQYDQDADVCRSPSLPIEPRDCWERAAERQRYCINGKGEVGWPPLIWPSER